MRGWLQCSARRNTIWSCTWGPAPPRRATKFSPASSDHLTLCAPARGWRSRSATTESLCPQWLRVTIARCWRTDDKSDVKPRLANLPNGVARSSFRNLQIDRRMQFTKLTQELGYKARQD